MSFVLPAELRGACEDYAAGLPHAEIARRVAAMSERYRRGRSSQEAIASREDVAAYLLARLPASYAAVSAALSAAVRLLPAFAPASLLDLCAGPGTASLAAFAQCAELRELTLIDANPHLLEAARLLLGALPDAASIKARLVASHLDAALARAKSADLVIMSYALVELPEAEIAEIARRIFALAGGLVLLVEPGTPEGFRRLLICRDALVAAGAQLIAPCPHALPCPMRAPQWCHFRARLPRSRAHRLAKEASVPFEDEPYAYLAAAPAEAPARIAPQARIVSRLRISKAGASCRVCARDGELADLDVLRRERDRFALIRRAHWGDALLDDGE